MNKEGLKSSVEKSNAIFNKIKEKYNDLSGYLVFSSSRGQCDLTDDFVQILKEFPEMIADSAQKKKALEIVNKISLLEKTDIQKKSDRAKTMQKAKSDLSQIIDRLEIKDDTFVEIRFKGTDLNLIFELQKDELVSQKYTPQTTASIRIVLCILRDINQLF